MLRYALMLVLSFLGLHIGTIMAHFTKPELELGKKYFLILKSIIFSIVIMYFFLFLKLNLWLSLVLSGIFFLLAYFTMKKVEHDFIFYTIFSIILFETKDFNPYVSILIFFYGILVAGINYTELWQTLKKLTLQNLSFLVFGLLIAL